MKKAGQNYDMKRENVRGLINSLLRVGGAFLLLQDTSPPALETTQTNEAKVPGSSISIAVTPLFLWHDF